MNQQLVWAIPVRPAKSLPQGTNPGLDRREEWAIGKDQRNTTDAKLAALPLQMALIGLSSGQSTPPRSSWPKLRWMNMGYSSFFLFSTMDLGWNPLICTKYRRNYWDRCPLKLPSRHLVVKYSIRWPFWLKVSGKMGASAACLVAPLFYLYLQA